MNFSSQFNTRSYYCCSVWNEIKGNWSVRAGEGGEDLRCGGVKRIEVVDWYKRKAGERQGQGQKADCKRQAGGRPVQGQRPTRVRLVSEQWKSWWLTSTESSASARLMSTRASACVSHRTLSSSPDIPTSLHIEHESSSSIRAAVSHLTASSQRRDKTK